MLAVECRSVPRGTFCTGGIVVAILYVHTTSTVEWDV